MDKKYFANVIALSFGVLSITAEGIASSEVENTVFDAQPKTIKLTICEDESLSLTSISQMISRRNLRDQKLNCSSPDRMRHL